MVASGALALVLALSAANETVLLEFSAQWCGPCRTVEPTVQRLIAEGYPIRQIDVDRESSAAAAFRVTSVPCFVMLVDGREVDRVLGAASRDRLLQLLQAAAPRTPPPNDPRAALARGTPTAGTSQEPPPFAAQAASPPAAAGQISGGTASGAFEAAQRLAAQATVRLRIEDGQGHSMGTGTVIDTHDGEALVITCGHIFRESGGKGTISVDVFAGGTPRTVRGQLVSFDLTRDIGFVSIVPGVDIQPVRVAPAGYPVRRGTDVFSVGCNNGGDPSLIASRVTAIDKYLGSPNIEVAGQPVQGRSGGGLFGSEGLLIGVCNAADPRDNEGIYAGLATIHWQLDQIGQRSIYQPDAPRPVAAEGIVAEGNPPAPTPLATAPPPPRMPTAMSASPAVTLAANQGSRLTGDTELICIVRCKNRPEQERLLILPQPSAELLERLVRESQPASLRGAEIPLQPVSESPSPAAYPGSPASDHLPANENVIRAQSADR